MTSAVDWQLVLLDLLNTTPVVDGRVVDRLADSAAARTWLRGHAAGRGVDLIAIRAVRDDLQRVVRGQSDASVLSRHLRDVRQRPEVGPDGIVWLLEADWPARVVLAWGEIQRDMPGRLRPCANEECRLFLIDHSRAGTARWCSMSGCGNRMKARRHYRRTRRD